MLQQELLRELHSLIGVAELDISFIFKTNQIYKKNKKLCTCWDFLQNAKKVRVLKNSKRDGITKDSKEGKHAL